MPIIIPILSNFRSNSICVRIHTLFEMTFNTKLIIQVVGFVCLRMSVYAKGKELRKHTGEKRENLSNLRNLQTAFFFMSNKILHTTQILSRHTQEKID